MRGTPPWAATVARCILATMSVSASPPRLPLLLLLQLRPQLPLRLQHHRHRSRPAQTVPADHRPVAGRVLDPVLATAVHRVGSVGRQQLIVGVAAKSAMVAAMGVRPSVQTAPAPVQMHIRAAARYSGIAVLQVIFVGRLQIIAAVVVRVGLGHVPK